MIVSEISNAHLISKFWNRVAEDKEVSAAFSTLKK
jgi:hypothetical protein